MIRRGTLGPSAAERLWSLLFPCRCLLCGALTPGGEDLCPRCAERPPEPLRRELQLDGGRMLPVTAAFPYTGGLRETLHRLKFRGEPALRKPLGRALAAAWEPGPLDGVTWVPMGAAKRRKRGYNQSALLARALAKHLGVPVQALLELRRETATQHDLDREARRENVRGAYRARPQAAGKRLLLVDDIVTTGATLTACAEALYAAGAQEVSGICAAGAVLEEITEEEG